MPLLVLIAHQHLSANGKAVPAPHVSALKGTLSAILNRSISPPMRIPV